jgi:hypothetical protein
MGGLYLFDLIKNKLRKWRKCMAEIKEEDFKKLETEVNQLKTRIAEIEQLKNSIDQLAPRTDTWFKFELKNPIKICLGPGGYLDIAYFKGKVIGSVQHDGDNGNKYLDVEIHSYFSNQNPGFHDTDYGPITRRIAAKNIAARTPIYI